MPVVDANLFPKVLFTEGTVPANPASGNQAVYLDTADHKLKRVNSAGVVTIIEGGGAAGAVTQIQKTTLGVAAASIHFASIAGTYNVLQLVIQARSATAATFDTLTMEINTDAGANYDFQYLQAFSTTLTGAGSTAQTVAQIGYTTGATSPANAASSIVLTIPNYAGTTFRKEWTAQNNCKTADTASGYIVANWIGEWRSAAAITDIVLALTSAANLAAGTTAILYGIT